MSVRTHRLLGAIFALAGSILVLLGFFEPWLPAKIYELAPCTPEQRGCADYYVTSTVTLQHVAQNLHSLYHDFPNPAFASTGLAIQLHNEPGRLAPTLWLFLGYALIWGGWWLLTRAWRAAEAGMAKGQ